MEQNRQKNQEIKGYRLLGKIALGGMSEVYKAMHPILNKEVILKKLFAKAPDAFFERFKREAKLMMDISHPNIAHIFDYFKEDNASYIVMEYISGYNLSEFIKKYQKLPAYLASYIAMEIAKGLSYAHSKGIIHRDIKPGNVLISLDGEIKLTDFGIAFKDIRDQKEDDITKAGALLGTPAYMSPEQIYSSKDVDKRTDIYALGILFYEMLTGNRPYKNDFTIENILNIRNGKYPPITSWTKGIPKNINNIVKKMIAPNKDKRFASVDEFIDKIDRFIRKKFKNRTLLRKNFNDLIKKESSSKELNFYEPKTFKTPSLFLKVAISLSFLTILTFLAFYIYPEIFVKILPIPNLGIINIDITSFDTLGKNRLKIFSVDNDKTVYNTIFDSKTNNFNRSNLILPTGKYLAHLYDSYNDLYLKNIVVYPYKETKQNGLLKFKIDKKEKKVISLDLKIYDNQDGKKIDNYRLLYKNPQDSYWKEYDSGKTTLLNDSYYDLTVLKDGYNIAFVKTLFIPHNQTNLFLEFGLIAKMVEIKFISKLKNIEIFVNDTTDGYIDNELISKDRYKANKIYYIPYGVNNFKFVDKKNGSSQNIKKTLSYDKRYMVEYSIKNKTPTIKIEEDN